MPDDLNQPPTGRTQAPTEPPKEVPEAPPTPQPEIPPQPPPPLLPTEPTTPTLPTPPTGSGPVLPSPPPAEEPPFVISTPPQKPKVKIILSSIAILFILASIPAAVFLVKQRQEIRKGAVVGEWCEIDADCTFPEQCVSNTCQLPPLPPCRICRDMRCVDNNVPQCTSTKNECDFDEHCGLPTPTQAPVCNPGACCGCSQEWNEMCVCGISGKAECSSSQWCKAPTPTSPPPPTSPSPTRPPASPTPGDRGSYCSAHGYTRVSCSSLPGDFADCETNPTSNGACCKDTPGNPYCCWSNGTCSGGQRQGCKEVGPGKVEIKGKVGQTFTVIYTDCPNQTSSTGSCSENERREQVKISQDPQYFEASSACGGHQVDVSLLCGSYRFNGTCGQQQPPTASCEFYRVYNASWVQITDFSTIRVGQTLYLATRGSTNEPQGITKARFKINNEDWRETTTKRGEEFYIQYLIPAAGTYTLESEVYNPTLGWQ